MGGLLNMMGGGSGATAVGSGTTATTGLASDKLASNAIAGGLSSNSGLNIGSITGAPSYGTTIPKMSVMDGAMNYMLNGKFNPKGDSNFFQQTMGDNRIAALLDKTDKLGLLKPTAGNQANISMGMPPVSQPSLWKRRQGG